MFYVFQVSELAGPAARRQLASHMRWDALRAGVNCDLLEFLFQEIGFTWDVTERREGVNETLQSFLAPDSRRPVGKGQIYWPPFSLIMPGCPGNAVVSKGLSTGDVE